MSDAPTPRHPGETWMRIFGAGGNQKIEEFDFAQGATDQYYGAEPGINGAPNPATYAQGLNGELDREAKRHGRDYTVDEVREMLGKGAAALDRSLQIVADWGYDPSTIVYGTHKLQSLRTDQPERGSPPLAPQENDPWGFLIVFPEIPANDKNDRGQHSERTGARYLEGFTGFLEAPQAALALMEQNAVTDGKCIKLRMPGHNGPTRNRNAANCKSAEVAGVIHSDIDKALSEQLAA